MIKKSLFIFLKDNLILIKKKMSHNHSDDISGKIFFKFYKAQKKLGEGSFGKIYTAINTKTKEEFALKLVKKKINKINLK